MDISNKRMVIVTHYLVYGAPQALQEYLVQEKIPSLLFIAHPLQVDHTRSYLEICGDGVVKQRKPVAYRSRWTILNYFFEYFFTLWAVRKNGLQDLFVGVDSLNAFAGICLKKMGRVRRVIFYTIDYVPQRFTNRVLNEIYHWLDRFCLTHADETWNVSPRIAEGRELIRGLSRSRYTRQRVVPIGVWFDRVKRLPFKKIKKHQLLFVGNLLEKQGVQLVIGAIPEIIKKLPQFHFLVVGGGPYEEALRAQVEAGGVLKHVTFTGWVKDRAVLDTMMADSALAIAMYDTTKDSFTYYADATKLKDYLSAGLPILLTDVPYNAYDIVQHGCGAIVNYDESSVTNAIIDFLQNEERLVEARQAALTYIVNYDWRHIFRQALEAIPE